MYANSYEKGSIVALSQLKSLRVMVMNMEMTTNVTADLRSLPDLKVLLFYLWPSKGKMYINSTTFEPLFDLQHFAILHLNCKFSVSFYDGSFAGLSKLKVLTFDVRTVEKNGRGRLRLKPGSFRGLNSLESLSIEDTLLLEKLDVDIFKDLSMLKSLKLTNIRLTSVAEGIFASMSNCKDLNLGYNNLRNISRLTFTGLTGLVSLDLGGNQVESIEIGAFQTLVSLEKLNLENNNISVVSRDMFNGLTSLTSLSLSYNSLASVEDGAFSGLVSLKELLLIGVELDLTDRVGQTWGLAEDAQIKCRRGGSCGVEEPSFCSCENN